MYFGHNVISQILLCVNYVHSITQIYVSSTLKFVYMVLWYANFIKKQILIVVNLNVRSMRSATSSLVFNEPVILLYMLFTQIHHAESMFVYLVVYKFSLYFCENLEPTLKIDYFVLLFDGIAIFIEQFGN